MKVLVTGHEGYIGRVLTPLLQAHGHEVVGLDSGLFADCIFGPPPVDRIPTIRKDLRDVTLDDLKGFDAVIHLAALCNDPLGNLNRELTVQINYEASLRLAELAKKAGIRRFLNSSSCSIYGAAGQRRVTEAAELQPVTAYGECKRDLEKGLQQLADDRFSPVHLRNATAYGFSPALRLDLVLNDFVAHAFVHKRILILSDGTPWRPVVHVEDISRAFLAALEAPRDRIHGEAFNVGLDEENYQVRELAELVAEIVPGCRIEYAPGGGPDRRSYRVDFSKIRQFLPAFRPQWNARKGIEQLYQAFKRYGLRADDLEGPRFKRLGHVRSLMEAGVVNSDLRFAVVSSSPKG